MNLLLIASRIVFAAKVDDLKKKHPEFSSELDELNSKDPSKKGKYLEWSLKQLKSGGKLEDIIPTVELFHNKQQSLSKKDINQYTLKDLESELKNLSPSKTQKKKDTKVTGSQKIYEDGRYLFIRMDSEDACMLYGSGTKWCITMDDDYYGIYAEQGAKHYFLIDKSKDQSDKFYKVAITLTPYDEVILEENSKPKVIDDLVVDLRDALDNELRSYKKFSKFIDMAVKDYSSAPVPKEFDVLKNPEKYIDTTDVALLEKVVKNIDPSKLPQFINHEDRYVRMEVSIRIDPQYLPEMMNDEYVNIRQAVARRIDPKYLPEMMNDKSPLVRQLVARRIDPKYLPEMMNDENRYVVEVVKERMGEDQVRTSSEIFWENYNF